MRNLLCVSTAILGLATFTQNAHGNFLGEDLVAHTKVSSIDSSLLVSVPSRSVSSELEQLIVSGQHDDAIQEEFGPNVVMILRRAYAARVFKPIWTESGAQGLLDFVDGIDNYGLSEKDVFKNDIKNIIDTRFDARNRGERAEADLQLSLTFLRAATAVSGSLKDEGGVDRPTTTGPSLFNLTAAVTKAGQGDVTKELNALEPTHPQYKKIKLELDRYKTLMNEGGWLALPKGKAVEIGERDPRIPALKNRLEAEGFLPKFQRRYLDLTVQNIGFVEGDIVEEIEVSEVDVFDAETERALKLFQTRHGLESDGVLGNKTINALNESVESKVDRIADALERWRHQGDLGARYIWANIPSYTAEGWDSDVREISMRTVVGKARFATPEFSDEIEYVVANPKWFVPVSITRRQKLPKMRQDASYAEKNGYSIFDRKTGDEINPLTVDWSEDGVAQKYRFVQDPGAGNALGEMKIIFPNEHSIYLHGTPTKHLFDRAQRAFSSGCVRLEDPAKMAAWIAQHDKNLDADEIHETLESGDRERMVLDEKLPVHLTYFTVTANDDGSLNFWRDVYDRDDGIQMVKRFAPLDVKSASLREETI